MQYSCFSVKEKKCLVLVKEFLSKKEFLNKNENPKNLNGYTFALKRKILRKIRRFSK